MRLEQPTKKSLASAPSSKGSKAVREQTTEPCPNGAGGGVQRELLCS